VRRFEDPLLRDVVEYERWKGELGLLRTFWAGKETRLALLGLEEGQNLQGVLRVLKVPFSARKRWGGKGGERGEIQDIFLHPFDAEGLKALLVGAERVLSHNGLLDFGISEWKETYWEGPGDARLQPLCPFGPYRLGYEERDS